MGKTKEMIDLPFVASHFESYEHFINHVSKKQVEYRWQQEDDKYLLKNK